MIYVTRLLFWTDALTVNQSLILIRPEHQDDTRLIAHELVHQSQMCKSNAFVFWVKYLLSRKFRLAAEVEAYKVQILHGAPIITCASHLTRYGLGITQAEAMALLTNKP